MPNAQRWSPEEIDFAKSLWLQGKSATDVSRALLWKDLGPERTRNSVIGMIHREGFQKRTLSTYNTVRGPSFAKRRRALSAAQKAVFSPRINHNPNIEPSPAKRLSGERAAAAALPPLVKWEALSAAHCKYPCGDPKEADFGFCGRERVACGPYCAAHTKLCYEPPKWRPGVKSLKRLQQFADRNMERAA